MSILWIWCGDSLSLTDEFGCSMYLCFCVICNLFIYILCYYVSEVILGDSLGRDTSENKGTAPGLSWGAPEKVRDMVFVWLPVLFRSNSIPSPKWAYQENQSASIYGKGLWRDPTVCGLNCKFFSCQDYLFTLPLPKSRLLDIHPVVWLVRLTKTKMFGLSLFQRHLRHFGKQISF